MSTYLDTLEVTELDSLKCHSGMPFQSPFPCAVLYTILCAVYALLYTNLYPGLDTISRETLHAKRGLLERSVISTDRSFRPN